MHAYERTNPMRAGQPTTKVGPGGTVYPAQQGTTNICAGGAGQGLYRTWYGATDSPAGDTGDPPPPKVWQWNEVDGPAGGSGTNLDVTDTAEGFSAFRHAHWHCLVIDVTAPHGRGRSSGHGAETRMHIRAIDRAQTMNAITDITQPATMDSVTLVRQTQRHETSHPGG